MRRGLVIVDAVLVATVLATGVRLLLPSPNKSEQPEALRAPVQRGHRLAMPGVKLARAKRHVVFVLDPDCDACRKSVPMLRRVAAEAGRQVDVDVLVLTLGSQATTREWLGKTAFRTASVVHLDDPGVIGIHEVPTLLITDNGGIVTDIAQRVLSDEAGARVLERIQDPNSRPFVEVTHRAVEVGSLRDDEWDKIQSVDVRERQEYRRGHRPTSVNIPFDELQVRALAELDLTRRTVVDCTMGPVVEICRAAGGFLVDAGFTRVSVLVPRARAGSLDH